MKFVGEGLTYLRRGIVGQTNGRMKPGANRKVRDKGRVKIMSELAKRRYFSMGDHFCSSCDTKNGRSF